MCATPLTLHAAFSRRQLLQQVLVNAHSGAQPEPKNFTVNQLKSATNDNSIKLFTRTHLRK